LNIKHRNFSSAPPPDNQEILLPFYQGVLHSFLLDTGPKKPHIGKDHLEMNTPFADHGSTNYWNEFSPSRKKRGSVSQKSKTHNKIYQKLQQKSRQGALFPPFPPKIKDPTRWGRGSDLEW